VTGPDERQLLALARGGDAGAYGKLVRSHQDAIYGLVTRLVRDSAVAEELTQDTFLKAYRKLDTFRGDARFSTWLYRIAVNLCHDYRASAVARMRREETSLNVPESAGFGLAARGSSPDEHTVTLEVTQAFQQCLDALDDTYRVAFLLRHQEDRNYEEIAGVLGISLSNAKVRVHRAREAILRGLRDRGHEV